MVTMIKTHETENNAALVCERSLFPDHTTTFLQNKNWKIRKKSKTGSIRTLLEFQFSNVSNKESYYPSFECIFSTYFK